MRSFGAASIVSAVALLTPVSGTAASVSDAAYRCEFDTVRSVTTSGRVGVAWGYVVDPAGGAVSVRCYVRVNGAEVVSTTPGTGIAVAATAGRSSFGATSWGDDVDVCAEGFTSQGSFDECSQGDRVPPTEVIDAIDGLSEMILHMHSDPLVCGVLLTAGVPAAANIVAGVTTVTFDEDDCDVYVDGERFVDLYRTRTDRTGRTRLRSSGRRGARPTARPARRSSVSSQPAGDRAPAPHEHQRVPLWALAIKFRDDYAAASVPMLPVVAGVRETAKQIVLYSWAMVAVSLLFHPVARMGNVYLVSCVVLGAMFLREAHGLAARAKSGAAVKPMRLFHWSITCLTLLFAAMAVDQLV